MTLADDGIIASLAADNGIRAPLAEYLRTKEHAMGDVR
jgi:hypothetical protein